MASVEQREASRPAGLATLEMFDKYKELDEDKDSDEESFHLTLLDSEEDLGSINKTSDTPVQNGETEDDILNKFECTTPDPVDPKVEDNILNEENEDPDLKTEAYVQNKTDEKMEDGLNKIDISKSDVSKTDIVKPDGSETEVVNIIDSDIQKTEATDTIVESNILKAEATDTIVESDVPETESTNSTLANVKKVDDAQYQDKQKEISVIDEGENTKEIENVTEENKNIQNVDTPMELEEVTKNDISTKEETIKENIQFNETVELKDNKNSNGMEVDDEVVEKTEVQTGKKETHETEMEIDETLPKLNKIVETEDSAENKEENVTENSKDHEMNVEVKNKSSEQIDISISKRDEDEKQVPEMGKTDAENSNDITENSKESAENSQESIVDFPRAMEKEVVKDEANQLNNSSSTTLNDTGNKGQEDSESKSILDSVSAISEDDKNSETLISESKPVDSESTTYQEEGKSTENLESGKDSSIKANECELQKTDGEANDSANSENLERDDLLDISVICDVDEDNAKAVAENASDCQTSEKSDNDEQEDKAENDIEESENDQDENICPSDKYDPMEFEDCASNSNSQFEENSSTNDNVAISNSNEKSNSDSLDSSDIGSNKEDVEMVDVLPKVIAGLTKNRNDRTTEKMTDEEKTENELEPTLNTPEEPVEYLDLDKHMAEQKKALENTQTGKRPLSSDDNQEVTTKKIRLSESPSKEENKKVDSDEKLKILSSFESFMRSKLFNKKLTKSDLEQFCIQKICEVIMHKTELGELHQMYRKLEQVADVLRKDIQQLSKQARDLDIVNKKLMNEIKTLNGKQKPLVPLKITRSVGLQVKLNVSNDQNRKKAPSTPNRLSSGGTAGTPPVNNRPRTVTPNSNTVRQITSNGSSPRKPQTAPNSTTPILSQALQTPASRQSTTPVNTAKRTPQILRPKTTEAAKPSNPGVIDLTDEDDRSSKSSGSTPVKILSKQVTTSKLVPTKTVGKSPNISQNKMVNINQVKTGQVLNKGTPTRTVTTLPQGVRLTPTGVKNGIAIPASVVTSSTGGAQLMYVVQPTSSLVTTTAQGGQKTVLLNFQPGNGILTSAINGSAVSVIPTKANVQVKTAPAQRKHPAPLPLPPPIQPNNNLKPLLPKPHLSIRKTETGIILQWRMPYNLDSYECIASYQLFAYQETNAPPSTDMWRKVGDVKALALPMACTLTQFADKNKYYFAVRSVDVHKRIGAFSDPEEISL